MVIHHVAVIGAGMAGLVSARHLAADPRFRVIVYEQADQLGGTWVYSDNIGTDGQGQPVHSSMYKSLRTNLPKEVMGFPDFPIPEPENVSYLPREKILNFLNSYADHFDLKQHIKFHHRVKHVSPREGGGWEVEVYDIQTACSININFDAIMVCNGHYTTPFSPILPGQETFLGQIMHSHDYRTPETFRSQRVLVVGAGPSGMDITLEVAREAQQVVLSHHYPDPIGTKFPENVRMTSDVSKIDRNNIAFKDGTTFYADVILLCTGYLYDFPFLAPECGITVQENQVTPLYKHLINIKYPTMCFVALPFYCCSFSMSDLQVRFFLKTLTGETTLPTKEGMVADTEREMEDRRNSGLRRRKFHMLGERQGDYYKTLADIGKVKPLPNVLSKLHAASRGRFREDLVNYRNDVYQIVDDDNFVKVT